MNKFLETVQNENSNVILLLLSTENILMTIMKKSQKEFGVKNPYGGINNTFVCVTGRIFIEWEETVLGNAGDCHVHILYSYQ